MLTLCRICRCHWFCVTSKCQKIQKIDDYKIILNIKSFIYLLNDLRISMKRQENLAYYKVKSQKKHQAFSFSLEDIFLGKPEKGGGGKFTHLHFPPIFFRIDKVTLLSFTYFTKGTIQH